MVRNKSLKKERIVLNIKIPYDGSPKERSFRVRGIDFRIIEHCVSWNLDLARMLIDKHDGYVDAVTFTGLPIRGKFGDIEVVNKNGQRLAKRVQKSRYYSPYEIRDFFASWTLRKFSERFPHFFAGKKILFHAGIINPAVNFLREYSSKVSFADCLVFSNLPVLLKSYWQLEKTATLLRPFLESLDLQKTRPIRRFVEEFDAGILNKWISKNDVFISTDAQLEHLGSLKALKGKTLVVDRLSEERKKLVKKLGVAQYLELIPPVKGLEEITSSSVLRAIIDICRGEEDSSRDFSEFAMEFFESENLRPSRIQELKPVVNKFAFLVHPLSEEDLLRAPKLSVLRHTPLVLKGAALTGVSRLKPFHYGRIEGIKSQFSGKEVLCEVYALPATPKQLMNMDEQFVYRRIVQAAEMAKQDGCALLGLGAYTKVVGDSGRTVARRSPIPVTNGNSYSAAATLWAAKHVAGQIGLISSSLGNKDRSSAQAMVIGSTGSIGRVSAKLLSMVFDRLVLVGTRIDKLVELRDEISNLSPSCQVRITKNPNSFLTSTDLIVTATSNQSGRILDIEMVKPGAIICDCSRPLDISEEEAKLRPDVLVIESGEIDLPGKLRFSCDIGLPYPSVYACLAETAVLALEERFESFSLGRDLSIHKVKEIYRLGIKHGADLAAIKGPLGFMTKSQIKNSKRYIMKRRHVKYEGLLRG